jgi:S1-C subfamily serine protease
LGVVAFLALSTSLSCQLARLGAGGEQASGDGELLEASPSTSSVPARVEDLARATVQVVALDQEGEAWVPIWSGSGSIIDPAGLILTNAHVIDPRVYAFDAIGIAVTSASDQPPVPAYLAEIVALDALLDLAVVRVSSDLDGVPVSVDLPAVELGDSDAIEIGDRLRILGYPGIGGETITFTEGAVSGFTLERGISGRAWIKTDATIAGGNSGGLGANAQGLLIGIPTIVTSGSEYGESVDCRPLADTDRDGDIDIDDDCVPVGGFINALRPINLALPLIEAARQGRAYEPAIVTTSQPSSGGTPQLTNLVFSDGVTADDQPTQLWYSLPTSPSRVCAFWDYAGMTNGLTWSSFWFVDGELHESGSISGQAWGGGSQGNWWTCLADENGLASGVYEIVLQVEGLVLASDAVFVGGDRSLATFRIMNSSGSTICEVNLSPNGARNWGQDDLGSVDRLPGGSTLDIPLASGYYDIRLVDCGGESLLENFGVSIEGTYRLSYTG